MPKLIQGGDPAHVFFLELLAEAGLPEPRSKTTGGELRFHPKRQWRFDYAWPEHKVAVERDGGVWRGGKGGGKGRGGHSGGAGQLNDMAKANEAVLLGWRILRYTPEQIVTGLAVRQIAALLSEEVCDGKGE